MAILNIKQNMKEIRRLIIFLILTSLCLSISGQVVVEDELPKVNFDTINQYFSGEKNKAKKNGLPIIAKEDGFQIMISNKPIMFDIKEIILKSPNEDKYPISYSVIYKDKLISLFEPGVFECHTIPTMTRDTLFENLINTKRFQYHWLIDNKLIGYADNRYYCLNPNNIWADFIPFTPITNQPKVFEDSTYIVFRDCFGEFGGTIYFYNKIDNKCHFTEATCANTVYKRNNKYFILSHLGHMLGSTNLKEISFPNDLPQINLKDINKMNHFEAVGLLDTTNTAKTIFDFRGIEFFSTFNFQGRTIYLACWQDLTFLTEIVNNKILIVCPLSRDEYFTHEPITTIYNNTILINMNYYRFGREREVSGILIRDNKLVKFDGNKNHSR